MAIRWRVDPEQAALTRGDAVHGKGGRDSRDLPHALQ
jgi:hypothetical protein